MSQSPGPLPDRVIDEICRAHGIHERDRFWVLDMVRRPTAARPACCGAGCDPCVDDVIAAADAIRAAMNPS